MAKPLNFATNDKSSTTTSPTNSTNQNSTAHACAACRFQRRKCAPNCALAPYFPAHKHQQFINAYKLFGVNNITKTLTSVPPHLRDDAMTALIYMANARAKDPVGGCERIVRSLKAQVVFFETQLSVVRAQIAAFESVNNDDEYKGFGELDDDVVTHGLHPRPGVHFSEKKAFDNDLVKPVQGIKAEPAHTKLSDQIEVYVNEDIKPSLRKKMEPAYDNFSNF